jgi:hypothetical protein
MRELLLIVSCSSCKEINVLDLAYTTVEFIKCYNCDNIMYGMIDSRKDSQCTGLPLSDYGLSKIE